METHRAYVNKKRGISFGTTSTVPPISVIYWSLIVYWLVLETVKTGRDLFFQREDLAEDIA